MDKPIHLGFAILEICKLLMYETYYDKLQPYFGRENLQLHYKDCHSFVLGNRIQSFIKDSKNFETLFDISKLDENHELFGKENKKIVVKFKMEIRKKHFYR